MKNKITPNNTERKMRDNDFIVSKTDTKGKITYANSIFCEFSLYSEQQLLGKQHNILRHPDMPRGVFKMLWEHIQSGNEFNGYVKNLCADGSFYWVFANVTPSYDHQHNIIGYFSVRRKPSEQALKIVIPLYQEMLAEEKKTDTQNAIEASLNLLNQKLEQGVDYDRFVLSL